MLDALFQYRFFSNWLQNFQWLSVCHCYFAGSSIIFHDVQLSRILKTTLLAKIVREVYKTYCCKQRHRVRINFVSVIDVIFEVILGENQSLVAQRYGCACCATSPSCCPSVPRSRSLTRCKRNPSPVKLYRLQKVY